MKAELIKNGYSFTYEFCGQPEAKVVIRLFGDWIDKADSNTEAIQTAAKHFEGVKNQFKGMQYFFDRIDREYKK